MDELHARLDRLVPPVEAAQTETALAAVHAAIHRRRMTQRRLSAAAAILVVVVVLASAVALARNGDGDGGGDSSVIAADGSPATSTPTGSSIAAAGSTVPGTHPPTGVSPPTTDPTAPSTSIPPGNPITSVGGANVADPSEVEVRVTLDNGPIVVGTRARFTVEVVNHSGFEAALSSGGCGPTTLAITGMPGFDARPAPWRGPVGSLAAHLDGGGNNLSAHWGDASFLASAGAIRICTAVGGIDRVAAGATLTRHYVWDAVPAPGMTELPRDVVATSSVEVLTRDSSGPGTVVEGGVPIALVDDPGAHQPATTFVQNVDASPVLRDWLARNGGFPEVGAPVSLGYHNGGFELWVDRRDSRLRVRGDTTTGAITEIRLLDSGNAPSDDPDATFFGEETILLPT